MPHFVRFLLVLAAVALVAPATTQAHFKLVEPAPLIVENERGDPQKAGPCGGSNGARCSPAARFGGPRVPFVAVIHAAAA